MANELPYRHLNLRRNPFGVPSTRDRAQLIVADVSQLADQMLQPKTAIQLMGNHGRGKSSRLFALQRELADRLNQPVPFIRMRDITGVPAAPLILLNEGSLLYRRA